MANRCKLMVPVNSEWLEDAIKAEMTIKQAAFAIGYSVFSIRRGLRQKKMSIEIVFALALLLRVNPRTFADFSEYDEFLNVYQK